MKKFSFLVILFFSSSFCFSQGQVVMSGNSFIVIDNSAKLVVENPNTNAIINSGTGGIKTESEFDQVVWMIGTGTGAYVMPFVGSATNNQIPFTANITAAGTGAGEIRFSTYPGVDWDNNAYRPSDVTHMFDFNTNSINNSLYVIDRFWIIDPLSYGTLPSGTFDFTYIDAEHAFNGGNAIVEANLGAQRFHSGPNIWGDYMPQGTTNVATNTTTGVPVPVADFYRSWTLSLTTNPLFTSFKSITTNCENGKVVLNWNIESDNEIDFYSVNYINSEGEVEYLGSVNSSNSNYYSFTSNSYREGIFELVAVDFEGNQISLSKIAANCTDEHSNSVYYSNDNLNFNLYSEGNSTESIGIFDAAGRLVQSIELNLSNGANTAQVPFVDFSTGMYIVKTLSNDNLFERILK
jgi:hypothetical protein